MPIHSVRIWVKAQPSEVRKGDPTRIVGATQGSNLYTRIKSVLDEHGREIAWDDEVVPRLDALRNREQMVTSTVEKFTLFANEHVLHPDVDGNWQVYRVLSLAERDIELRLHYDGRISSQVKGEDRVRIRGQALRARNFRKVSISPTGILTDALTGQPVEPAALENQEPPKNSRSKPSKK